MKALEKDRNRRYETANGFAMDVQRYLGGRGGPGRPAVDVVPLPQVGPEEPRGIRRNTERASGAPPGHSGPGDQQLARRAGEEAEGRRTQQRRCGEETGRREPAPGAQGRQGIPVSGHREPATEQLGFLRPAEGVAELRHSLLPGIGSPAPGRPGTRSRACRGIRRVGDAPTRRGRTGGVPSPRCRKPRRSSPDWPGPTPINPHSGAAWPRR